MMCGNTIPVLDKGSIGMILRGAMLLSLGLWSGMAQAEDRAPLVVTITKPAGSQVAPSTERLQAEQWQIPGGASVVDESSWQDRRASTVKDMLDYAPGVSVQARNGAEAERLSIRGSGLTRTFQGRGILLLQDGIPINTADGSFDFQVIDPWLIDRVAVYRGASALHFGSSTLGGLIDFVTPTGLDDDGLNLRAEAGGFGELHGEAGAGIRQEATDGYAALSGFHDDGYRDQNRQNSARFAGNAGWKIAPGLESRFYVGRIDSDAQIPGTLSKALALSDPTRANSFNVAGDYAREVQVTRLGNKTSWHQDGERIDSTLYWSGRQVTNPSTTFIDADSDDEGWRASYEHAWENLTWRFGTNLMHGGGDDLRTANLAGARGARIVSREQSATTLEAYTELDRAFTQKLHGLANVQYAYAERDIEETFPTARTQNKDYSGVSPRVGLRYDLTPGTELFTNLSGSYEPPTLSELSAGNAPGFVPLDAQSAVTGEVGTRGHWGGADWELAFYRARVQNEFITYRFANGSTSTVNADQSIHQGIELGGQVRLAEDWLRSRDGLALDYAYQFSDFRLEDDPVYGDNRIPAAPEHTLRGALIYETGLGLRFGPNVEWVPKGYDVDLANTLKSAPYAIAGFTAGYTTENGALSASLDLRNLFDTRYIATTGAIPNAFGKDQAQFYPGEGRALYAGLRLHW